MSIVFNTVAKPSGSLCNLSCKYCFYLDKPRGQRVMSDDVLETYIRRVIDDTPSSEVSFCWQGESRRYAVFLFIKKWCACSNDMPTAKLFTTVCKPMAY